MNYSKKILEYSDDFSGLKLNQTFWSTHSIMKGCLRLHAIVPASRKRALKISVKPGDLLKPGGDNTYVERSEISEKSPEMIVPAGVNIWYAFSVYIPKNFKIIDNRLVFAQWHSTESSRSPQMALRYRNGKILFTVESNEKRITFKAPSVKKGIWYRLMVNHTIGKNHQGECRTFLNGQEFAHYKGIIGHPKEPVTAYFKMGIYRDKVSHTDTLYFANFRRGLSIGFCDL